MIRLITDNRQVRQDSGHRDLQLCSRALWSHHRPTSVRESPGLRILKADIHRNPDDGMSLIVLASRIISKRETHISCKELHVASWRLESIRQMAVLYVSGLHSNIPLV